MEPEVLQVLHLPRKTQRGQCVPRRRQTSADLYGAAPSAALGTQTDLELLTGLSFSLSLAWLSLLVLLVPCKLLSLP